MKNVDKPFDAPEQWILPSIPLLDEEFDETDPPIEDEGLFLPISALILKDSARRTLDS